MCGRFTLRTQAAALVDQFGLPLFENAGNPTPPRYNIAPTQPALAVRTAVDSGRREPVMLRWGLIPSWSKDPAIGNRMINARAETVAEKPSFRRAFRSRRCLIPADGYYEWQKTGGAKQPYFFHRPGDLPFAFAGLWEAWTDKAAAGGEPIESFTIITTEPNDMAAAIHNRMPAILEESAYDLWLDTEVQDADRLYSLLKPVDDDFLIADPVSTFVNKPTNDGPQCIEPL
jgi:putative SOS response-associated peptidase YedK